MINVLTVGTRMGEPFEAFGALKRFFARVQSPVLRKMVLVLESLVALCAFVGTLI